MKKKLLILPIVLVLGLSACSPKLIPTERKVQAYYFDFSDYYKEGFFISPDPYQKDFESCGTLLIKVIPAKTLKKASREFDAINGLYSEPEELVVEEISAEELLNIAVKEAKSKGADAIVNFKCTEVYHNYYNPETKFSSSKITHYEVSGFAIKRKN